MAVILLMAVLTVLLQQTDTQKYSPSSSGKDILEMLHAANHGMHDVLSEGDIMKKPPVGPWTGPPTAFSNADPCTISTCKWPKSSGTIVRIPVKIDSAFTAEDQKKITDALAVFKTQTCIRFTAYKSTDTDYIHVINGAGCWSYIGFLRGEQMLSLSANGCLWDSIIQHEFLHALGFEHEHSRSDRDGFVRINWSNISPGAEGNFEKVPTNNLQTNYDFTSVLQYGPRAFSVNNNATIEALDPNIGVFGSAAFMSPIDIELVNRLYGC